MTTKVKDEKEKSKVTKDEWREYTKTVWSIANTSHSDHPAVFPVEIPHRLIKLFSFWDETVLDPFAGVGTPAKAAIETPKSDRCCRHPGQSARNQCLHGVEAMNGSLRECISPRSALER